MAAAELRAAVAEVFARRLELSRPPWALTLLGTLEDGRAAIMCRVHHVLASGMTATALFAPVLFDLEADAPAEEASGWRAEPAPSPPALAALALRDRARSLWSRLPRPHRSQGRKALRAWPAALRDVRRALSEELEVRAPDSPLTGPLSGDLAHAFVTHSLDDLRAAGDAVPEHATINDVVVATIAGGLARWLRSAGLPAEDQRAQIPVSLVVEGEASFGASTSFMIVDLPVSEPDPLRRVERVSAETRFAKGAGADAIRSLMALAFRLPGPLRAPILRRVSSDRVQNLIVSDVPGPPVQLYLAGGAVSDAYPVMMLSPRHRLRIAAISIGGRISFGITADPTELGDPQGLAESLDEALAELAAAASG